MGKTRRVNKGRIKDEWMHLHSRPAGPHSSRKTKVEDEDLEGEEFIESEEPFFFEDDIDEDL